MLEVRKGNLLNAETDAIVYPVDCIGNLLSSSTINFRLKYPENFERYRKFCKNGSLKLGGVLVHFDEPNQQHIINLAVLPKCEDFIVEKAINTIAWVIEEHLIESIAVPKLSTNVQDYLLSKFEDKIKIKLYV